MPLFRAQINKTHLIIGLPPDDYHTYDRQIIADIIDWPSDHARCLEIAPNRLPTINRLLSRYKSVIALERYPERIFSGDELHHHVQSDWSIVDRIFAKSMFDLIVANHVLEHLYDDVAVLNATGEILNEAGNAYISTPNRKRLFRSLVEYFIGERKFPYWEHYREYSFEDIRILCTQNYNGMRLRYLPIGFGIMNRYLTIMIHPVPKCLAKYCLSWLLVGEKI